MEFIEQSISGLYLIKPYHTTDDRGSFVKAFNADAFKEKGLETDIKESYFSDSVKGVVRGMHFQIPPHDHAKIVFCTEGEILDVVLDLRSASPTYKQCVNFNLSSENRQMVYIPRGMAHGFTALSEKATVFYFVTSVYNKTADLGVRWDSFGFNWPVTDPIISERDTCFPTLSEFTTPF